MLKTIALTNEILIVLFHSFHQNKNKTKTKTKNNQIPFLFRYSDHSSSSLVSPFHIDDIAEEEEEDDDEEEEDEEKAYSGAVAVRST